MSADVIARVFFHVPESREEGTPIATLSLGVVPDATNARNARRMMRNTYRAMRKENHVRHAARDAAVGAALMWIPETSITWDRRP